MVFVNIIDRGAEVGPTAPSADDPPPYEENCAIGLPQLIG